MINAVSNNPEPPYWRDWFAISLRWLSLLGLSLSLATQARLPLPLLVVLVLTASWNILLSILVLLKRRLVGSPGWHVVGDLFVASAVFHLSSALDGPVSWAGIMPVLTAALYYKSAGILLVIGTAIVVQAALGSLTAAPLAVLVFLGPLAIFYLLFALAISMLGRGFERALQKSWRQLQKERQDAERAEQDRKTGLYQVLAELSSDLCLPRLTEKIVHLTSTLFAIPQPPSEQPVSALLLYLDGDKEQARLQVKAARGLSQVDFAIELTNSTGLFGRAISAGEVRLTKNIPQDPELARFTSLRDCGSACCVPVVNGNEVLGVLLLAHPDSEHFSKERRADLEILGRQAGIAINNALLYRQLEVEKDRITEIHEETRVKLARELHDGPTQSIAALAMRVNFARRLMDRDLQASMDELLRVEDLARKTTKEIRHMLFTLRPLVLESQGLISALELLGGKMRETFDQMVSVAVDPEAIEGLDASKQAVLYYIAEEAVNNARKHASAEHIWIRITVHEKDITLVEIEDDGVGFSLENPADAMDNEDSIGLGIRIMQERSELVNGVLKLCAEEGKGTCIQVFLPLSDDAIERLRHEW